MAGAHRTRERPGRAGTGQRLLRAPPLTPHPSPLTPRAEPPLVVGVGGVGNREAINASGRRVSASTWDTRGGQTRPSGTAEGRRRNGAARGRGVLLPLGDPPLAAPANPRQAASPPRASLPWSSVLKGAVKPGFWFSVSWAAVMSFPKVSRRRRKDKGLTHPQRRWGDLPHPRGGDPTAVAWAGRTNTPPARVPGSAGSFDIRTRSFFPKVSCLTRGDGD